LIAAYSGCAARIAGYLIVAALASGVAGCDSINRFAGPPTPTQLPVNMPLYDPPGTPVAVCYNKDTATPEALTAAALAQCPEPGSTVEYLTGDLHINDCPVLKKRRAVYVCREPRNSPPATAPR
jgi:hypothetical protein